MLMGDFIAGDAYEKTAMELPNSTYIGSVDTFNEDLRGSRFICEGYLIDRDEKPRILPPRDTTRSPRRGLSPEEPSSVLDLLLVDRTGPMRISIWGFCVDHFLALMESVDTKRVLLRFDPMRKAYHSNNAGSGPPLTPIPCSTFHTSYVKSRRDHRLHSAASVFSVFNDDDPRTSYNNRSVYHEVLPCAVAIVASISRIFSGYGNEHSQSRRHPARGSSTRV